MKKSVSLVKGFFCAFMLTGLFVTNSVAVSAEAGTEKAHEQELKVEYPTGDLSDAWKDNTVETIEISKEEFDKLPGARLNRVTLNSYRTDDYYYNMLNDTDKKVYEAYLTASKKNLDPVESTQNLDFETQAELIYKGNQQLGTINWTALTAAMNYDHPEQLESILYSASVLSSTWTSSDGTKTYAYYFVFRKFSDSDYTGADLAQMESELQTACNSFYNSLNLSGSDFDKELAIHDALIESVEYNHDVANYNRGHDVAHTAYGALVNKLPVCDGYSKAFKMLLNKAGIECHVVAGLGGGGGHAWNIVKNGGDYYEVDATWDDQTSADDSKYKVLLLHDYFNRTTADFESHSFDVPGWVPSTTKHIRNENYLGYLTPAVANGTQYSYKNAKKVYTVSFDGVVDGANVFRKNGRTYEGKIIEMPSSVWATGYVFDGWYTEKTGGTKVDADTVLSGDTTLYAHWTGKKITVTLRSQNGQTNTTKEVTFGDTYGELPNNLTRTGYIFAGWYTDTTYKTRITEETKVDSTYNHSIYAKWVAGEFTTTFDANGGTVQTESIKKTAGEYLGGFETPERYGYTFAGWYDAKEGGSRVYSISSVVGDRTLYAHWTPIRSRVVFYNNDGYSSYRSGYVNYSQTYESAFTSVSSISRAGYNLIGWFTEPEGGIQITADTVVDQVEERNLYAHWEKATVRVYFHADGSNRELQWVDVEYGQTYGDAIDALAYEPVKEHATFDGWSTSSSIFSKVTRSNTVTAEKHFYAHFVDDTFTLYLNANGGKFSGGSVSKSDQATYGTEMSFSQYAAPTRDGYTFKGWSTVAGSAETVTSVTLTQNTTVYAVWEKKTFTLTLRGNDGSFSDGSSTKNISTYYGDDVNLDQYEAPTRNGYTFKGWGASATDTTVINAVTVSGNVTVYAIWTKNAYTLKLSGNGGKFSNGLQTKEVSASYGDSVSLGQYETPTRDGYTFKGWCKTSTGSYAVNSVSVNDNITVYAIWSTNSYGLTLSGNGGKFSNGSQTKEVSASYRDSISLSQYETPTKDGYTFKGWSTSSTGTSAVNSVTVNGNTTVYAIWEKIPESSGDNNQSGNSGSQSGSSQPTQGDNSQSGNSGSQGGSSQSAQGDNNQSGNSGSQSGSSQPEQGDNNQSGDNNQPAQPENKQPAAVIPAQPANDVTPANVPVDATITDGGKEIQLSSTGVASVIDNGDMNVSSVTIGDTVTYEGITYNITEIKDNAYRNRKKLKSFTVGANIERIGSNAFNGCKSLKKITIKANNLKAVSKGSFKGIKNGAKITVICKDKKTFNKVTKMLKKAGAKKVKFKFKKG